MSPCPPTPPQATPAAQLQPGLLPAGERAQHGERVHAHLRGLREREGRGWIPLHGLRLPGDLRSSSFSLGHARGPGLGFGLTLGHHPHSSPRTPQGKNRMSPPLSVLSVVLLLSRCLISPCLVCDCSTVTSSFETCPSNIHTFTGLHLTKGAQSCVWHLQRKGHSIYFKQANRHQGGTKVENLPTIP